jgi:hypothetical protein
MGDIRSLTSGDLMSSTTIRTSIAGAVAAAGLTLGGIGFASAADNSANNSTDATSTTSTSSAAVPGPDGFGHGPGGPGHGAFHDSGELAKALGVTQAKLDAAFEAIRDQLAPPAEIDRSNPPTEAERTAMRGKLATALAAELDLTKAKVLAAMDEVEAAHQATERTDLATRLTAAVKAGTLTSADKASVLKAFDAGVLGGPRP